ncbi:hypothetical protein ABG768_007969, partial [Culter alburnus]
KRSPAHRAVVKLPSESDSETKDAHLQSFDFNVIKHITDSWHILQIVAPNVPMKKWQRNRPGDLRKAY